MKDYIWISILIGSVMISCEKVPISGCMDPLALNYIEDAVVSDSSCEYSTSKFYFFTHGHYDSVGTLYYFDKLEVFVAGEKLGELREWVFQHPRYECEDVFTETLDFVHTGPEPIPWNSILYLKDGPTKEKSGEVMPNPDKPCQLISASVEQ